MFLGSGMMTVYAVGEGGEYSESHAGVNIF